MFNFEFPEALKKPLDLLYSHVTGVLLAPKLDFDAAREGQKKTQKQKQIKGSGGRPNRWGGSGRRWSVVRVAV